MGSVDSNATASNAKRPTLDVVCPACSHGFAVPGIRLEGRELSRRAKLLLENIRRAKFGRPICPFCDKPKSSDLTMFNHLRRDHAEELMQPPGGEAIA